MVTRSLITALSRVEPAITHRALVVSTDIEVTDAIALLSGLEPPKSGVTMASSSVDRALPSERPPSCLVVQEEGRIIGIFTSQDIARLVIQRLPLENLLLGQVMSYPVISLDESAFTAPEIALQLLQQNHIQHLPIVDEQEHFIGLVTYESLCLIQQLSTHLSRSPAKTKPLALSREASPEKNATVANPRAELSFHQAIQNAPFPIMLHAEDGEILQINRAWTQLSGYEPRDIPNTQAWAKSAYGEQAEQMLKNVIAPKYDLQAAWDEGEFTIKTKQGEAKIWHFSSSNLEKLPDGRKAAISIAFDVTERQKLHHALSQSEERYHSIFDQAAVGFVNADAQGNLLDANPFFCHMLGYSREELLAKTVLDITHPDDQSQLAIAQQNLFEDGFPYIVQEKRYVRKNGSHLWARICVSAICDQTGQIKYDLAVIQDISDRKAAEAALKTVIAGTAATTGKDFFPAFVSHIAKALQVSYVILSEYVNDDNLQTIAYWANGTHQPNFSFPIANSPCAEVLKRGFIYYPNSAQEHFPESAVLSQINIDSYMGISLQNNYGENIGSLCILDSKPIANPALAETLLSIFANRAVAEQERQKSTLQLQQINSELETAAEARAYALLEQEHFLKIVLEAFPFPVFWKDVNSLYLGCNQHFLRETGLTSIEDLKGKSDDDLPWDEGAAKIYQSHDQDVIQSASAKQNIIHTRLRKDSEPAWFEAYKVPLRTIGGEVIGVVGMYQDISDRKQSELQLQQTNQELARATKLKDEFLANMSHELRTPLNAILGMTEGLQDKVFGEINPQQLNALDTIEKSSKHLLELINDILDVAKIEAGQVQLNLAPTGLVSLCESSLAFIKRQAQKKQIQVQLHLQPDLPLVMIDARRIRQALINLLSNAVKFTPSQGIVTLEVTYKSTPNAAPDLVQAPAQLRLAVQDNGIGIRPQDLDQLFQPFIQIDSALNRQFQGTGLGLALVKRIAELHGGIITAESQLGQGSCFTITLPCDAIASPMQPQEESLAEPSTKREHLRPESPRVLLVEDNDENILTLSSYLEAKGYELRIAKQGQAAIAQAKSEQPDIILMDIQMPGMDGLEAIRQIRLDHELAEIPIIAVTALAMTGDRDRCLAAGANEYLSKPVQLRQLVEVMQQLMA